VQTQGNAVVVRGSTADPHQDLWEVTQHFMPAAISDAIEVATSVQVNADKAVVFLPLLTVLPGVGSFGTKQAARSLCRPRVSGQRAQPFEADVRGPAAHRLVPDTLKITCPLMAIQEDGRYVAVNWEMQPEISALFDSPDRTFNAGGHALALLFPGSDGIEPRRRSTAAA